MADDDLIDPLDEIKSGIELAVLWTTKVKLTGGASDMAMKNAVDKLLEAAFWFNNYVDVINDEKGDEDVK